MISSAVSEVDEAGWDEEPADGDRDEVDHGDGGQEGTGDGRLIQPSPTVPPEAIRAFEKISQDTVQLIENPKKILFLMGVDSQTGRPTIVAARTSDNFKKLSKDYPGLPRNIRETIESRMPEGEPEAMKTLMAWVSKQKALEEKPEDGQTED